MKHYIVSEEELLRLRNLPLFDVSGFNMSINSQEEVVKQFLKDKKPVEIIAGGIVTVTGHNDVINTKIGHFTLNFLNKELSKSNGKSIEIWIKEM